MSDLSMRSENTFARLVGHAPALTGPEGIWRTTALAMLSTRMIQGFVYWGGGSRRFIYAPSKLNLHAHT
jgi:hypothetical protein